MDNNYLNKVGLRYWPGFYQESLSRAYLNTLILQVNWSEDHFYAFDRRIDIPRLQAWYADDGIKYSYSNNLLKQQHWHPLLLQIKKQVEDRLEHEFNSVLLTYYRNGKDSVSWHADDEYELGNEPWIASLSLGTSRIFQYRNKHNNEQGKILLNDGDLLLMQPKFQQNWQHQVPEQANIIEPRLNLTFRKVIT